MSGALKAVACFGVLAIAACDRGERSDPVNSAPSAAASAPAPPPQTAEAAPQPVESPSSHVALFADKTLLTCVEKTFPPKLVEAAAKDGALPDLKKFLADSADTLAKGNPDVTVLKQPCSSLGQQALTTCTEETDKLITATHYYQASHSDKYMAECVKKGGTWSRNSTPEADLQRAQQQLEKLDKGGQ